MNGPTVVETTAEAGTMTVTAPVRHLCPFKDEVDDGTVRITYSLAGRTLELHSLRAWLDTLADRTVSHEDLTRALSDTLTHEHHLADVRVVTEWETAGMHVVVTV